MLDAVSLVIIALAVFDVAKFLVEEEISRDKEMRSAQEARQTLAEFITIVIIVSALTASSMSSKRGRRTSATRSTRYCCWAWCC